MPREIAFGSPESQKSLASHSLQSLHSLRFIEFSDPNTDDIKEVVKLFTQPLCFAASPLPLRWKQTRKSNKNDPEGSDSELCSSHRHFRRCQTDFVNILVIEIEY